MDFVTQCRLPFQQVVEALTATLARWGFAARRNFDLRSAAGEDAAGVNYTVMLIRPEGDAERLHIVVAHERAGRLTLTLSSAPADEQMMNLRQALGEALVELGCWSWEEPRPDGRVMDPVCGKALDPQEAHAAVEWNGQPVYLCCALCQAAFEQEPHRYVGRQQKGRKEVSEMAKDPVCGMMVDEEKAAATSEYEGQTYYFCAQGCKVAFDKDPEKYLKAEGEMKHMHH